MRKLSRTTLGPHFSEAARRLWLALDEGEGTQQAFAAAIGTKRGHFSHLLYGDRRPGRELALRIKDQLGIDMALWVKRSAEPFVLPAVRAEQEARAKLETAERPAA